MKKVEDRACMECGKAFHPVRKDRQFCSKECAVKYRKANGGYEVTEGTRQLMSMSHCELNGSILFGITKEDLLKECLASEFPGTNKWAADNPIWDCNIAGYLTPKEAWKDPKYLSKAIDNLYTVTKRSKYKYPNFVRLVEKAFRNKTDNIERLRCVLTRFTVAKIAPKVTALMPTAFERILSETGINILNGIYCPMAGFGGIIEGAKRYYKDVGIEAEIEAYDINPNFCKYYGWVQRDVLAQKVKTDKVVFVCPPFGPNTERWKGTPDDMYYSFEEWVKLIKEHVEAPEYIFVGPEIGNKRTEENPNITCGLFSKKYGIQWYPEYSNDYSDVIEDLDYKVPENEEE